jgi:hypothetical protein
MKKGLCGLPVILLAVPSTPPEDITSKTRGVEKIVLSGGTGESSNRETSTVNLGPSGMTDV